MYKKQYLEKFHPKTSIIKLFRDLSDCDKNSVYTSTFFWDFFLKIQYIFYALNFFHKQLMYEFSTRTLHVFFIANKRIIFFSLKRREEWFERKFRFLFVHWIIFCKYSACSPVYVKTESFCNHNVIPNENIQMFMNTFFFCVYV